MAEFNLEIKHRKAIFGFYISLITNIIFLILISLSHYYAIIHGYEWWDLELSELVYFGSLSEIFFMTGVVINSIGLLFVLVPLTKFFQKRILKIIYVSLILSVCGTLFLLGAVTERLFPTTHYIFGAAFFFVTSILIIFISVYIIKNLKEISKIYPIFGFITFGLLVFHLATRWFFGMAYTQRLAVLFSMIYLLLIGRKLLLNKDIIIEKQMTEENKF
ncbi:MAG TPA: hypothetical protein VMZ29_00140 [Candidatus Bathyarchaeia archaeon]|nr:hypothetical protein [Candidatus Bathyarchaeia archaeon]